MAAVLGARLARHVQQSISVKTVYLWSDSQIVLHWLHTSNPLKTFVANRVKEIHDLTEKRKWRYCPTAENPADLLTRGITSSQFKKSNLWMRAPDWLNDNSKWPYWEYNDISTLTTMTEDCQEHQSYVPPTTTQPTFISGIHNVLHIQRFSRYRKLLRVTAYALRFIYNCKNGRTSSRLEPLTVQELHVAEKMWLRSCQTTTYHDEIESMKSNGRRLPLVKQLRLFIDDPGDIRCGGRIHNAPLDELAKFPYLLPARHSLTRLIVLDAHVTQLHAGVSSTVTHLRQKYWIPTIRRYVQSVLRKCVICRKTSGRPYPAPDPPPLPKNRVEDAVPFTVTGVDFTGALYIRNRTGSETKIKQIQNLIRRNYWVVLVLIVLFALMSIRFPSNTTTTRSYRTNEEMFAKLQFDDIRPFQVITEREIKPPEKVKHVAFLKVHKSGSTTAQNMFLRFGWDNNLTFVLPHAHNIFRYPNIISLRDSLNKNNTMAPPIGKIHELLCNHVIYNRTAFRQYLPNDTVCIGILREPYEMFKSTLNYLRPGYIYNRIKLPMPASEYLKNPAKYEPKNFLFSFTNNRMAAEFGCPEHVLQSHDKNVVLNFIKQLDQDFGLVIIAEYFEESVVLMRRLLMWSIKDILYLDKNVAKHKSETGLVGPFDRQLYKQWSRVDYALYEHFFRKLRDQIRAEGLDFDEELLYFKEVRKMASEFCRGTKATTSAKLIVQKSKWSDRFELTKRDCELLQKSEMTFVQDIREKQYGSREI